MADPRTLKDTLYEMVARVAKAAASPKRLELVELLCQAPKTVERLAREANISMKLASVHLKALRNARLVDAERHGKYVVYRLASEDVARFWVTIRRLAEGRLVELRAAMQQLGAAAPEWEGKSREELLRKTRKGDVVVIDVRPPEEYAAAHLPCARSMPLAELKRRLAELPKRKPIVVYCRGPLCFMAADAVKVLRARGFDAKVLKDGVAEWAASGSGRPKGRGLPLEVLNPGKATASFRK